MKNLFTLFFLCLLTANISGQTPTWATDIAPLMYARCTSCHHTGGLAPFSLMTYNDVLSAGYPLAGATAAKTMPPFPPDPNYRHYANENYLTDPEIDLIQQWVAGGSPEGNSALAPTPPTYNNVPAIPTPDLMATIPTYTVSGSGDVYRCFAIPSGLATTSYITELEVIPGNSSIVHHVLVFQDTTQTPVNLDNSDPNAGYNAFGGTGSNASQLIGAWVPGSKPTKYPQGMGVRLPANANIVIQVHYPSGSAGASDSTQIRFKLATGNIRQMYISPVLNHTTSLTNGPLYIPANTVKTFNAQYTVPANVSVYSVSPHMHLIGKSVKSYGITPGTLDTIPLIKIDNWDFHWQGAYAFKKLQKIGIGTKLKAEIVYDNTLNNPYNPSNPPIDVAQGESTTDEMMLIYFSYLIYQPGDENIVIDATPNLGITPKNELSFSIYPNPAKDFLQVNFPENVSENLHFSIWDTNGRLLKEGEWDATYQKHFSLPVNEFATGNYWLKVSGKEIEGYKQWISEK